jgi:hypothetical protein
VGHATGRQASRTTLAGWALTSLVAAACPAARGAEATALTVRGPWDMIAFEVKSWGRPVTSWRLLQNGSGSWTETVAARDAPASRYSLVWHEFDAGELGYERVATELSRLPMPAPDSAACADYITDLPYGTIRLTRGATTVELAWNSGCMDADYKAFIQVLKAADSIVAGWGRAGRVLRTEPLPPSR